MKDQSGLNHSGSSLSLRLIMLSLLFVFLLSSAVWAQTPWKFIAVGDTRGTSSTDQINTMIVSELANEIVHQGAKFVIVPGDLVYSGSEAAFRSWKNLMANVDSAGIKILPVLGNHDASDIQGWINVFGNDIPDNGPLLERDRTYYYTYDNVLVIGLDNYVKPGLVNQAWVNTVLALNTQPHVFAFGHLPAFKANHPDCLDDYPADRDTFWKGLKNANVRAYFAGHDHFYDHARIDDGDGNADNDVHQLIVGSGGAPFHTSYSYNGANTAWTPVNQFHEAQYGYSLVEIDGPAVTMTFYKRTGANTYAPTTDVWRYTVERPPIASATGAPTSGNAPLSVSFNGSGSSAPNSAIVSYAWNFGDDNSGSGVTTTHTYTVGGTYTATLTVTDNNGLSDSANVIITVTQPPVTSTMHIGDLDGTKSILKKSWTAKVAILVHDDGHKAVSGAVVTGDWNTGSSGSCTTNTKGSCSVSKNSIPLSTTSVSFTVNNITKSGATYQASVNHDVDGGSDGTKITIVK